MKKIILILLALISLNCYSQYQYLGSGASTTKLLLHLNGNSNDASGNGNNGSDTTITYSQANGRFGQGAWFNGSSSKIILADNASLKPTGNFTISCWLNITSVSVNGTLIFQSYSQNPNRAGIRFYMITTGRIQLLSSKNTGNTQTIDYHAVASLTNLINKGWVNCIGVFDGIKLYIYINGNLESSVSWTYSPVYATTNYVRLGCRNISGGTDDLFFNGSIDELFLENRAWTAQEVKKYYTFSKGFYTNN